MSIEKADVCIAVLTHNLEWGGGGRGGRRIDKFLLTYYYKSNCNLQCILMLIQMSG